MRRVGYSREANIRMLKCGIPALAVVLLLILWPWFGQKRAVPKDEVPIKFSRFIPPKDKPIESKQKKEEVPTRKPVVREEKPKEPDKPIIVTTSQKKEIEAPPITTLPSEGTKTPPGPPTGYVFPKSEKKEYSGPPIKSSGIGGVSSDITDIAQVGAVESGQVQTTKVQIVLLAHDFTNYHKHEDTLNSYRDWLNKNTLLRDEDSVQLLGLTQKIDRTTNRPLPYLTAEKMASTTVLFMTGDDLDVVLASNERTALRQGLDGVRYSFSATERNALKTYVEGGGTFFFNYGRFNYGRGEEKFKNQVRGELEQIFRQQLVNIPAGHKIYTVAYNLPAIPNLKGIEINGRLAVIFSESDVLGNYKFLTNVLWYALGYR